MLRLCVYGALPRQSSCGAALCVPYALARLSGRLVAARGARYVALSRPAARSWRQAVAAAARLLGAGWHGRGPGQLRRLGGLVSGAPMIIEFSITHLTELWGVQDLVFVSSLKVSICRFVRKYALGPEPWSVTTAQYVTTPTPTPTLIEATAAVCNVLTGTLGLTDVGDAAVSVRRIIATGSGPLIVVNVQDARVEREMRAAKRALSPTARVSIFRDAPQQERRRMVASRSAMRTASTAVASAASLPPMHFASDVPAAACVTPVGTAQEQPGPSATPPA